MKSMPLRTAGLVAALVLTVPSAMSGQEISLEYIGQVNVTSISADGTVATGTANDTQQVIRWTSADGVQRLGRNAALVTGSTAGVPRISDDGNTIGATIISDNGAYFTQGRWRTGIGWKQLEMAADSAVVDFSDGSVFGMSRDGKVITGLYWRANSRAAASVWNADTKTMVAEPDNGDSARADGANADGSVVVGWAQDPTTGARMAAVWENGVKTMLPPENNGGEASAVNAAGNIVVGISYNEEKGRNVAAMWKKEGGTWTRTLLGTLPGTGVSGYSGALSVSDDGSIVGGYNRDNFGSGWAPDPTAAPPGKASCAAISPT